MKYLLFLTALLTVLALSPPTIQCPPTNKDPNARTCYASVRRWPARATSQPRMPSSPTKIDSKASTCHGPIHGWPTDVTIRSRMQTLTTNLNPTISTCYVPVRRWPTRVTIQPRMHRARPDELSLSPPALPNSPSSGLNNTSNHNKSTSPSPQIIPQPPTWTLTVEDLVTAVYRIVNILLTLFNINITWRFHGKCHSSWRTRTSTTLTCPLANHGHHPREARRAWAGVRFV